MADTLSTYRKKRDFAKTPEPRGAVKKHKGALRYVIQKHDASRLHFDFRLELDGVYKSWAVPKGPSLDQADKRLAMHVEDHPLEYGTFEGTIPKGQYGGGTVQLWDEGYWRPENPETASRDLANGKLKFRLDGKRLQGGWTLVRMHGERNKDGKAWLLIKERDEYARPGGGDIAEIDESVKSGRTLEQIAANKRGRVWHSNRAGGDEHGRLKTRATGEPQRKSPAKRKPAAKRFAARATAARKADKTDEPDPFPDFVPPQLAQLHDRPPNGEDWIHEIKFDGYRIQFYVHDGKVVARSRRGLDWTEKFTAIADQIVALPDCVLDGEMVALNAGGEPDFSALQDALSRRASGELIYFVFDLLYAAGHDLRNQPLIERKQLLRTLIAKDTSRVRYVEHFTAPGDEVLHSACRAGLEGIMSKHKKAPYVSGRPDSWIKTKCRGREEFVIGGYSTGSSEHGVGALLVGAYEGDTLRYRGRVGTGYSEKIVDRLKPELEKRISDKSPFVGTQPAKTKDVHWLKPELVAEVDYAGMTGDGLLRHASFKGLREDKPARQVALEKSTDAKKREKTREKKQATSASGPTVSNPDKLIWPDDGVSKQDLANYFATVADLMLPFVANRPLTLVRVPDGIKGQRFYQRHAGKGASPLIKPFKAPRDAEPYLYIESAEALGALAQMAAVEIHPWGATVGAIERPDQLIFDLDPAENVTFAGMKGTAFELRDRLKKLGFETLVKFTGGKGIHVVVPLKPRAAWPEAKAFARALALQMERDRPDFYTTNMRKALRSGRIFLDYLRNDMTSTAIAPWSPRIRPGAPIAVPITWPFLKKCTEIPPFTMKDLKTALKHAGDWKDFEAARKPLDAATIKKVVKD
jgi:bifunctional non-homologous end joining protein LigD